MPSIIQSVIFEKKYWNLPDIRSWIRRHNYTLKYGIDEKKNFVRIRQIPPQTLKKKYSNGKYITKKLPNHIEIIIYMF